MKLNPSPDVWFGPLFEAVQLGKVFPDSKTFTDCTPKRDPKAILADFETLRKQPSFDLTKFVLDNFELPKIYASRFQSDSTRTTSQHIQDLWQVLIRKPEETPALSSLIPLPRPYLVPGGRFGEIYYWDSYFTMLGLQADGRWDLIQNMVDNFAFLIQTVGHIPNGNRTYYQTRSQPPFFALMVTLLAEGKGNAILGQYLPELEKEYTFWMAGREKLTPENISYRRVVRMPDGTVLNRFWDDSILPRPEAYKEDLAVAKLAPHRIPSQVYRDLRAAAESGWDFSARWFKDGQNLPSIHTTELVPIDLNCLMYNLEVTLSNAYRLNDQIEKADSLLHKAKTRKQAILRYLWQEESQFFYDYDLTTQKTAAMQTAAATFPLFFRIASQAQADSVAAILERDFLKAGGLITTNAESEQQWDAPNGWAPHQWTGYIGFKNYGKTALAETLKQRWLALNTQVYRRTGKMMEKYNVVDMNLEAGGGEYPLQDGFGWSNGVFLRMIKE